MNKYFSTQERVPHVFCSNCKTHVPMKECKFSDISENIYGEDVVKGKHKVCHGKIESLVVLQ